MLLNYIKIAFRNIARHKGYAAINITGLSIGIAACLLLFLVIRYETSYDKFQPNYDNIYHVATSDKSEDGEQFTPGVPFPALETFREKFPQAKVAGIFSSFGSQVTVTGRDSSGNNNKLKFIETTGVFFAEPEFFDIFRYKWLSGTATSLKDPNNVVLSESVARKYFGDWQSASGQFIKLDNQITLSVSGVIEDAPFNSDFQPRVVSSFITLKNHPGLYFYSSDWGSITSNFQVYMLLPAEVNAGLVNEQMKNFSREQYKDRSEGNIRTHFIRPLKDIHFDTRIGTFGDHITSRSTLWTLTLIGVLIIMMACINFINLSTAQAISRSKEVGLRKVLGGTRWQLFGQMMGETTVIVLTSIVLGVVMAYFFVPSLKHLITLQGNLSMMNFSSVIFLVAITLTVILLSGFYPSMVLSGFKPALALKNRISSAKVGNISLRRGLVVLQFAISQLLIVGTIVALSQMKYIKDADLGFKKEAVLVLNANADSAMLSRQTAFKEELLLTKGIQYVSFSADVPSSDNNWGMNFAFDGGPDQKFTLYLKYADEDYFRTYGLKLIAGRGYTKSDTTNEVVVNETLLKKLGIKRATDIIGKTIRMGGGQWKPVTGVVQDFKTNSLREEIKPLMIASRKRFYTCTGIKLNSYNIPQTQKDIQSAWDKFFPEYVNTSAFMDDSIANFYRQEEQLSLLYKIFAGLAIVISCLGLYGLVSFMAVQKTKEVGIRKVLGASTGNIVYLFTREFTMLILIAFVIAAPLAWYMMNTWLNNFAYKITLGAGVFISAVMVSIIIAWVTVGYKAIRAAVANPVTALRSE